MSLYWTFWKVPRQVEVIIQSQKRRKIETLMDKSTGNEKWIKITKKEKRDLCIGCRGYKEKSDQETKWEKRQGLLSKEQLWFMSVRVLGIFSYPPAHDLPCPQKSVCVRVCVCMCVWNCVNTLYCVPMWKWCQGLDKGTDKGR